MLHQIEIGQKLDNKFPKNSLRGCYNHLKSEIKELKKAIKKDDYENIKEELADCYLLLIHMAHKQRFLLQDVAIDKLNLVLNREYGKLNRKGFCEHIK